MGEAAISNAIEDARKSPLIIRKEDWGSDVVVTLLAPIVQFIAKNPCIRLADEHIFIVFEAQVELFREAKVAIVCSRVEITFVEELRAHHTFFAFDNRFVFVKSAVFMRDEDNVVLPQDSECLADGRTFHLGGHIFIYRYDNDAAHLSFIISMSPAESL